jgi:hypothetical protein
MPTAANTAAARNAAWNPAVSALRRSGPAVPASATLVTTALPSAPPI